MRNKNTYTRAAIRAGDAPVIDVRDRSLVYRERIFIPLWVTFLQETLASLWRLLARLIRLAVRHPVQTALLAGLVALYRWAGWLAVLTVLGLVAGAGTGWRYRWPGSFERQVTTRARSWWRWRRIYRRDWHELMDGCGLTEPTSQGQTLPQIGALIAYRDRDDLTLHLPAGQVPDDITACADALTHALKAWRVTTRNLGRGRVQLLVYWTDPLASPLTPRHPNDDPDDEPDDDQPPPGITAEMVLRRLAAVVVGRAESGGPWTLALLPGRHLLVSGSTGSGKSGLLWAIVWDLAGLIRAGWITITAFDPKYIELRDLTTIGLGTVHTDVPAMPGELEALVAELDVRCAGMTSRQHVPSLAEPVRLVVIDELATLTALADTKSRRRVEDALGHLLSRGRAAGFEVILTSVEATKDVVRWRGLCATRVCYRTDDDGHADLVLGDGARDRGAATELIPENTPGIAYTRTEGRRDITRVRTFHISDQHIAALAPALAPALAEPSADPATVPGQTAVIPLPAASPEALPEPAMNCPSLPQLAGDFAARARAAGYPILDAAPGRWTSPGDYPCWSPAVLAGEVPPNDLLDAARETARRRVCWIHAVLPTHTDAISLAAAIQPATAVVPRQPSRGASRSAWATMLRRPARRRGGDSRQAAFTVLVEQIPLTVVTLTARDGTQPVHVVEIPAAWAKRSLPERQS